MISILIPIYNRKVTKLVETLFDQCVDLNIEFEILCYDDCSQEKYRSENRVLGQKMGVSYMDLSTNLGRSKIRNWLGKNARFEYLIFLDCDSLIERKTFVKKYFEQVGSADVVYGGTSYSKRIPGKSMRLHWKYGKKVEAQPLKSRMRQPYTSFRSNNFMIKRSVFMENRFDESITTYGYEDTLVGMQLEKKGISIKHIDNPAVLAGLEKTDVFLKKTKSAIDNLTYLQGHYGLKTRLIEMHEKLEAWGLIALLKWINSKLNTRISKSLYSENPSLLAFQWYKLLYFIEQKK